MVRGNPSEQEAGLSVGLRETFAHDADDDLVGDKCTGLHELLRRQPHLAACGDRGAQHVAGGDVRQREAGVDTLGLRAFAGAGGAQKDDVALSLGHRQAST